MKAIVYEAPLKVSCAHVPPPQLQSPQDVIVRVSLCALCGSDLHVYEGREPGPDLHTPMGHEFVGEVVEAGRDVKHFRPGDKVVSPFSTSCGSCFYCTAGLTSRCERSQLFGWVSQGVGVAGCQAEYVRVPVADGTLMRMPDDLSAEAAILLADILPTGYFAADQAQLRPGCTCVVVGCGPVGLMAVASALELGAAQVFAVDNVAGRLALAQAFGATPLNFADVPVAEVVRQATQGRGADCVLELAGNPAASRLALDVLRPGGVMSIVGVHNEPHFSFSPNAAYDKNLTLKIGRCPARFYMGKVVEMVRSGRYNLESVISHRMTLDEGEEAYRLFAGRAPGCTKIVFAPRAC